MKSSLIIQRIFIIFGYTFICLFFYYFSLPVVNAKSSSYGNFKSRYDREWQYELSYEYFTQSSELILQDDGNFSSKKVFSGYGSFHVNQVHISSRLRFIYGLGLTFPFLQLSKNKIETEDITTKQTFLGGINGSVALGYRIKGKFIEILPKIKTGISVYAANTNISSHNNIIIPIFFPAIFGIDIFLTYLREIESIDRLSFYFGADIGYPLKPATLVFTSPDTSDMKGDLKKHANPISGLLGSIKLGFNYEL